MKARILDTNLIVGLIRNDSFKDKFYEKYPLKENNLIISVVTQGEILALSLKWKWGRRKVERFMDLVKDLAVYPIKTQKIIDAYAKIDA